MIRKVKNEFMAFIIIFVPVKTLAELAGNLK